MQHYMWNPGELRCKRCRTRVPKTNNNQKFCSPFCRQRAWVKAGKNRYARDPRFVQWLALESSPEAAVMRSQDIAQQLGLSNIMVNRFRRAAGYKKEPYKRGLQSGLHKCRKRLLELYAAGRPRKELAAEFGVTEQTVTNWVRRIGAKRKKHNQWKYNEHPRGFTGGKHTEETKMKMSEASRRMWQDPKHRVNSVEFRQAVSDRLAGRVGKNNYSRCKRGVRPDVGTMHFRSSWEANYARYLNWLKSMGEIHDWKYESVTFWFDAIKRGARTYTPDFEVWEKPGDAPHYIEVKGWMDKKSATKLKRMAKYHPNIKVMLVGEKQYKELKNKVSQLIPGWE